MAILYLEILLKQIPAPTVRVPYSVDLGGSQEFPFLINFLGDLGSAWFQEHTLRNTPLISISVGLELFNQLKLFTSSL